ncbi:MAG: cysteine dioxygenase family protein [Acidobacteria bacterium]|nr:cysteine dioxygenase family protein [Acidobacteriota bacterium]
MATQVVPRSVSIQEFVSELHKFPEPAFRRVDEILSYLERTTVSPETLAPYLTWNRQHYTRNLIDKTPLYELISICWEVGQLSSVHNHRDQNCWMAVPIGRLKVENFHLVSQDIEKGRCQLTAADSVEMNPTHPCAVDPADPVHRVVNAKAFAARAVSLHIYSRPFDSCVVYSPEQGTCGMIGLHYDTVYGRPATNRVVPS